MKIGKSLTELAAELERQANSKRDFIMATEAIEIESASSEGLPIPSSIKVPDVAGLPKSLGVNDLAHDQIAEHCGIPLQYYRRMRNELPGLLDSNVNAWFKQSPSKRMVRTLDGNVRAFLSDRYRPLDNYDLAESVLPRLLDSDCRVESCELTEKRLYIKAVTERVTFEVKKGDIVQAGIVISNSEVGSGALTVEPLLFRLVCTNGMIANNARMRKTHVGRGVADLEGAFEFFRDETRAADDKAFFMKVSDTVAAAFDTIKFGEIVEQFFAAQQDVVEADPIQVSEVIQKRYSFNDSERSGFLKHLLTAGDMNRFGVVNAITRTAQDVQSYDRATELERLGGTVLTLPRKDWQVIAHAGAH